MDKEAWWAAVHGTAKSQTQSGPLESSVHGIFPARILEWVTISSSRGSSQLGGRTYISCFFCIAGDSSPAEAPGKPVSTVSE